MANILAAIVVILLFLWLIGWVFKIILNPYILVALFGTALFMLIGRYLSRRLEERERQREKKQSTTSFNESLEYLADTTDKKNESIKDYVERMSKQIDPKVIDDFTEGLILVERERRAHEMQYAIQRERDDIISRQPIGPSDDYFAQVLKDEENWRREQRGLSPLEDEIYKMDHMEGHAFETWCADLLKKYNFENVEVTPGSNDQGVDIVALKDGIKYAIQCKCYSSDLGNGPIQEVNTGKAIYHCHVGVVMTNRHFTQGAIDASIATGTLLWDRDKLIEMIKGA